MPEAKPNLTSLLPCTSSPSKQIRTREPAYTLKHCSPRGGESSLLHMCPLYLLP